MILLLASLVATGVMEPDGVIIPDIRISASNVDPFVHTGAPFLGETTLYLWFLDYDLGRADFALTGTYNIVSLDPAPGFVNVGSLAAPKLEWAAACDGTWNQVVAELIVSDPTGAGGRVCFADAPETGNFCFQVCGNPQWYFPIEGRGYATDGAPECWHYSDPATVGCEEITSIDAVSWGRLKTGYR